MENKKIVAKNGQLINYSELILMCIEAQTAQGITIGEMRENIKLIDYLKASTGENEINLTEDQKRRIASAVSSMRWVVNDENILNFHDYITTL